MEIFGQKDPYVGQCLSGGLLVQGWAISKGLINVPFEKKPQTFYYSHVHVTFSFVCCLPHQNPQAPQGQAFATVVTAVSLAPNRASVAVKDQRVGTRCSHDPAPRDHTTQAAHKKHFKLKKGKKYQCTNRNRGPSTTCNVVPPSGADSQKGTELKPGCWFLWVWFQAL